MCQNTGYLVTFSKSSNISYSGKWGSFQREKKGNKVISILHTHFILFVMGTWQRVLVPWLDNLWILKNSTKTPYYLTISNENQFATIIKRGGEM